MPCAKQVVSSASLIWEVFGYACDHQVSFFNFSIFPSCSVVFKYYFSFCSDLLESAFQVYEGSCNLAEVLLHLSCWGTAFSWMRLMPLVADNLVKAQVLIERSSKLWWSFWISWMALTNLGRYINSSFFAELFPFLGSRSLWSELPYNYKLW